MESRRLNPSISSGRETSMNLNNVPSKVEVLGWSPQSLADYMRRLKLSGCDKLVIKGSISGAKFMEMTVCDLQVFPSLYVPLVAKIQHDINKETPKKAFGQKLKSLKFPKPVLVQEGGDWESDEFDSESENDYEGSEDDGYICALTEPQTAEEQERDTTRLSSAQIMKPPRPPREGTFQNSQDPVHEPTPAIRTLTPASLCPPRTNMVPRRPFKAPGVVPSHTPAAQANQHIDRSKKPGPSGPSQTDLKNSMGDAVKASGSSMSNVPKPRVPKPRDVPVRASKLIPVPPVPTQPAKVNNSLPGQSEGLDPSWYGGKVTRHQAEVALREVNQDGAFVVRDSSRARTEHPYTLMLLKQGKVYNIMIRNQGNSFSLGKGLNITKRFPGVREMITHHTNNPLQLIDATDQSAEAQSQCCLLHPAGL